MRLLRAVCGECPTGALKPKIEWGLEQGGRGPIREGTGAREKRHAARRRLSSMADQTLRRDTIRESRAIPYPTGRSRREP